MFNHLKICQNTGKLKENTTFFFFFFLISLNNFNPKLEASVICWIHLGPYLFQDINYVPL